MPSKANKKSISTAAKRPKALTPAGVKIVVDKALSDEGSYCEMPTFHSSFDHPERKIDFNDILFGLSRRWNSCKADAFNEDEWQWKYKIVTQDIEGRDFTIVIALDPKHNRLTIITRWPND